MRAAVVERGAKLQALESWGRPGRVETYRLRGSGLCVVVRHGTRDVDILDEVFVGVPCYEPPLPAASILADLQAPQVLDLGGNIGLFGVYVLSRYPTAHLRSFEPDPANYLILERCREISGGRWRLYQRCVGVADGVLRLAAGRFADSYVTEDREGTIEVPCDDVFPLLDEADFVKMDIEGSEWPILSDPRLADARCRVIAVEWHERGAPSSDAYGSAVTLLRAAGYETVGPRGHDSHGVLWGYRAHPGASTDEPIA